MRKSGWLLLSILLTVGAGGNAVAQEAGIDAFIDVTPGRHATGALAVDKGRYEKIAQTPVYRDFLPVSADLSDRFPTPGNQGQMGSCVAWAVGYAARSYYAHAVELRPRNSARDIPSPAYIYNAIRPGDCDGGSSVISALQLLKTGVPSLAQVPYSDRKCLPVTDRQRRMATDFRIEDWRRVDFRKPDQIKAQIASDNPVVFAFGHTPQSFQNPRHGRVYRWDGGADDSSGHAMSIVGYDDRRQAFRIINSWGRNWGDGGFLWIGYDTVSRLATEAYVMTMKDIPVPPPRPEPVELDGIDLAKLRCSSLTTAAEGGRTVIRGFVGYARDLAMLRKAILGKPADLQVELRPWPQCEVLLTLADTLAGPGAPKVTVGDGDGDGGFSEGDTLPITVETPGHPTYLYMSYIQADGSVVNIQQPTGLVPKPLPAYRTLRFGDGAEGRAHYSISRPFGREMVVAVASKSPLFDEPLPKTQTEREYLSAMRKALIALPPEGGQPRIAAGAVAAFVTREKEE